MQQSSKKIKKIKQSEPTLNIINTKFSNPFPFIPRTLTQNFDLLHLAQKSPQLAEKLNVNDQGALLIDFNDQQSLIIYNEAIMKYHFGVTDFITPQDQMAPCLGNRINYIDWVAELINNHNWCIDSIVDLGTGSSAVYLLLAYQKFNWKGIGLEKSPETIENAQRIINKNNLQDKIQLINCFDCEKLFENVDLGANSVVVCNPPFYDVNEVREIKRIIDERETFTKGGEYKFIVQMIEESQNSKALFTTLIGRERTFIKIIDFLKSKQMKQFTIVSGKLYQGRNVRYVLAWRHNR